MSRILISATLLLVVYVISGCIGTDQPAVTPTQAATDVPPTLLPVPTEPTIVLRPPTLAIQPTRGPVGTPQPQIPPPIDTAPTRPVETVIADPILFKLVNEAKADVMARALVLSDEITVKSAEPTEWRDSSLGCPKPDEMYAQVITPGYLIVLETGGQEWRYHASTSSVVLCEQ